MKFRIVILLLGFHGVKASMESFQCFRGVNDKYYPYYDPESETYINAAMEKTSCSKRMCLRREDAVSCEYSHHFTSFSDCADTDQVIGCTTKECPRAIMNSNCNDLFRGSGGCHITSSTICYCNTTLCNSSPTINISKETMWTAFLLILSYMIKVCGIFV